MKRHEAMMAAAAGDYDKALSAIGEIGQALGLPDVARDIPPVQLADLVRRRAYDVVAERDNARSKVNRLTGAKSLVQIKHQRCGESAGTTLLWGPEDLSEEQFAKDVHEAETRLLTAADNLRAAGLTMQTPGFAWTSKTPDAAFLAKHGNMTVSDVQALWDKEQAEKQERHRLQLAAFRSFADHMHDLGYLYFFECEPTFSTEVDWIHRHGTTLVYGSEPPISPLNNQLLLTPPIDPGERSI